MPQNKKPHRFSMSRIMRNCLESPKPSLPNPVFEKSSITRVTPRMCVYSPVGHVLCAAHSLCETDALNVDPVHTAHALSLVLSPGVSPSPTPHVILVCSVHVSVTMVDTDSLALNWPSSQLIHCACVVSVPGVLVYVPAGHLVCAARTQGIIIST